MWWARRCQASYPVPVTGLVRLVSALWWRLGTLSGTATFVFSFLPPNGGQLSKERLCSSRDKCFKSWPHFGSALLAWEANRKSKKLFPFLKQNGGTTWRSIHLSLKTLNLRPRLDCSFGAVWFGSVLLANTANLILLHSERPKLYGVLTVLSATGLIHQIEDEKRSFAKVRSGFQMRNMF